VTRGKTAPSTLRFKESPAGLQTCAREPARAENSKSYDLGAERVGW
jgi:hypothetical protein